MNDYGSTFRTVDGNSARFRLVFTDGFCLLDTAAHCLWCFTPLKPPLGVLKAKVADLLPCGAAVVWTLPFVYESHTGTFSCLVSTSDLIVTNATKGLDCITFCSFPRIVTTARPILVDPGVVPTTQYAPLLVAVLPAFRPVLVMTQHASPPY